MLNPELAAILAPDKLERERVQISFQQDILHALSALGRLMNCALQADSNIRKNSVLLCSQAAAILSNLHYRYVQRRFFVSQHMTGSVATLGKAAPIDTMLFGEDFGEKVKALRCAERAKKDIFSNQSQSRNPTRNLNSNRPSVFKRIETRQQGPYPRPHQRRLDYKRDSFKGKAQIRRKDTYQK